MDKEIDLIVLSIVDWRNIFICNLSPQEMAERKEEIEKYYLGDYDDPWEWDWRIDLNITPLPCKNKTGYWQYEAFII